MRYEFASNTPSTIWVWPSFTSTNPTNPIPDEAHDTRGYARHLRGRVMIEDGHWRFEVVNTTTGKPVAGDNGHRDLEHAFLDAEFATAACRAAWMRGLTRKSLLRRAG